MLKQNKIMCFLFVLALVVLVVGQNSVSASSINSTDDMIQAGDTGDICVDEQVIGTNNEKKVEKNVERNIKSGSELEDLSLYMEDVEVDYGEVADLNVVTTPEVDEGILSWYIKGGLVGARDLSVSPASYPLNTLDYRPGNYTVDVSYTGSTLHESNVTSATLTIKPIESYVDNFAACFDDDNNIIVELNVYAGDEIIDYGQLNIYHGSDLVNSLEVEDYDVSFTVNKSFNGEVLIVEYVGDDYYLGSNSSFIVNVPKFNANLYMPGISAYYGSNVSESVTIYSSRRVNDGFIDVYVDGILVDEYSVTEESVYVNFNLENFDSGIYDVFLDYFGSDVYEDASYQTTLTVKKIKTTLYAYNVTGHRNESVDLRAYVYNYVDDTNEGMIEFLIDDESVKTLWLRNSSASVAYLIPDSMSYAVHELKVIYYGSERYDGDEKIAYLNVTSYPNSLSLRNYSLDDDGRIIVNVRSYSYNQTVDDGRMIYYVDDVLVGSVEVHGNVTSIVLPGEYEADKEYRLKVEYVDSDRFDDSLLTCKISPAKHDTSTRLYTYTNTNNILNITSYVYSTNYADINEGVVEFYINETMIGTSNVENNRANMIINMDEYENKNYSITAKYNGSKIYRTSQNNSNINYTRYQKTVYIQTTNTIKSKVAEKINISISLTDYEENKMPMATYIRLSIFDTEYPIWTDNGEINFEYNIPSNITPGTYNITIKSDETKDYKNASKNIKLNIYKDTPYITSQNIISNKKETILINATLKMNNMVLEENITGILKINNKTVYQGIFKNGQFQYRLDLSDKYTGNTYNITIKSKETNSYYGCEKTVTLTLKSRNTYILSQNIESKNGEQILINASIYDAITKEKIKGTSKVCIKINDVTLDNIIIKNGQLLYAYTNNYSSKDYNIKIIHGENGIYTSSTWNGTLTIKNSQLKIATNSIQTTAYNTINIKANILSQEQTATGPIQTAIKINNRTIHEETITNGKIDFNYRLSDDIGSGTYNLTIITGDSRRYAGNSTTVKLYVNKNYKEIETTEITCTENTLKIKARLVDINNNTITKNTKINIKLAGHTITDYNITDGIIDYNYTLQGYPEGIYDLLIQAGESSGYYHASTVDSIKIG